MAINKVKYGSTTLIDLTDTTATADKILTGYGAYGKDGVWMNGSAETGSGAVADDISTLAGGGEHHNVYGVDLTLDTVAANKMLSGTTAHDSAGNAITGNIATKTSSDLTASGATVTVPAGYYASSRSKSVSTMTLPTSASTTGTGTTKATIGRSTSTRYINIPTGYNTASAKYEISAVPNGSATIGGSGTVTPSISVNSSGLITATNSANMPLTPTISEGYISTGTAGTFTISGSATSQLTTKAAATITPTTTNQTIASGTYLTGAQTISGDANLTARNIKKDVTIFGVTGSYESTPSLVTKTVTPTAETQIVLPEEEELVGNYVPSASAMQLYSQGGEELVTSINKGYYIVDTTNVYYISTSDLPLNFRVTVNFQEARRSSQGTTVFATKTVEGEGTITSTTGFDVLVNDNYVQKFIVRPLLPYSGAPNIRIELYVLFSDISYSTTTFNNIHVIRTNLYLSQEYDGLSQVTVNGDANLVAGNIKKDVSIFGVTGTYEGSGSSYTFIGSTSYQVSTSSTSPVTVGTFTTGNTSIWTSDAMVYIKIRDTAGRRNGYYYGCDAMFCNNGPANNLGATSSYLLHGVSYWQNTGGYLQNFPLSRTGTSYATDGYGIYPVYIHSDGSIDFKARYDSIYTTTINGTFSVEVYLLQWPNNISPWEDL